MARKLENNVLPQKILITTDFFDPWSNGVATYVNYLATFFPDASVTILTYNITNDKSVEKKDNKTIIRIPANAFFGKTFIVPKNGLPEIEKHDVVITNTRFFTTSIIGCRLAKKWAVPHIHVEHGNVHVPHSNPLVRLFAWLWDQTLGRYVYAGSTKTVCIARAGLEFVSKLGAKNPIYIPNGIEPSRFVYSQSSRAAIRKKHKIHTNENVVIFVGRLVMEKGIGDLIESLSGSKETLLVVGDGPARDSLVKQAQKAGVKAIFVGNKTQAEIPAYLSAADIFVNPSWAEGLPTSVLEARANRIPILATDVGGTRDLVAKSQLLKPKQPLRWREQLLQTKHSRPDKTFDKSFSIHTIQKQWTQLMAKTL